MTPDDSERWRELFGTVVVTCEKTWDEAQSKFYFDALKEFPFGDVKAGIAAVMDVHRWPKIPMPGEFRAAIYKLRFDARRHQALELASKRLTATVHCADCGDSGMRESREGWYTPCACRDSNPNYQIGKARERLSDDTEQPITVGQGEAKQIEQTVRDFKRLSSGE